MTARTEGPDPAGGPLPDTTGDSALADSWLRPQMLVFSLLGDHIYPDDRALFSGSFIAVFERLGIAEAAVRATLTRMVRRGLLERHKRGRRMYFSMTDRCRDVIDGGRVRIWEHGAVNRSADVPWTLLAFSMPEAWQRKRHSLRSRLTWAGFGPLQNGLWIAPGAVDVSDIVDELDVADHVHLFRAEPVPPTDLAVAVRDAFDVDALAARYRAFLATWDREDAAARLAAEPLALTLRLVTEWLQMLTDDPRVPVHLLDEDWPAVRAQELFLRLHAANYSAAADEAAELFDTIELSGAA
ncbi:MAG: PaaX family transcriptional regulator C-terminal domain-containing protein [Actinomycetota bacterium]|nr:PaaX family transcriptional regulator C-terminal domain-containing protein [Actinomycetota bacterium]